jgi:hypothetical protein
MLFRRAGTQGGSRSLELFGDRSYWTAAFFLPIEARSVSPVPKCEGPGPAASL